MTAPDYLLGQHEGEWNRLEAQHRLWRHSILDAIAALELPPGASVLEIGCGPGALLEDLASLTSGPLGAIELDRVAAQRASERLGSRAEVRVGDVDAIDLGGPWHAVVARWVLSFLPDPLRSLERIWAATRDGGSVVVQDYHHAGLGIYPEHPAIERVVSAYRAAYRASGGDLFIGGKLAQVFAALGADADVHPEVRAARAGDEVWCWIESFLLGHLDMLVREGHLSCAEADAFRAAWAHTRAVPGATLISPVQVTLVARKGEAMRSSGTAT